MVLRPPCPPCGSSSSILLSPALPPICIGFKHLFLARWLDLMQTAFVFRLCASQPADPRSEPGPVGAPPSAKRLPSNPRSIRCDFSVLKPELFSCRRAASSSQDAGDLRRQRRCSGAEVRQNTLPSAPPTTRQAAPFEQMRRL